MSVRMLAYLRGIVNTTCFPSVFLPVPPLFFLAPRVCLRYTISMVITYYGGQFFKVQQGDLVLAYNPAKETPEGAARGTRFGADIALVSTNHPRFNGIENVTYGEKAPFAITGPGEYETKGVYIRGLETPTNYDGAARLNTVYYVLIEGMYLCFLGAVTTPKLGENVYEAISDVDILFVPVGGEGMISPAEAHKLSLSFSPRMIIPMYDDTTALKHFLKEAGRESAKAEEKLTLKKKDLEGKEGDVAVLKIS